MTVRTAQSTCVSIVNFLNGGPTDNHSDNTYIAPFLTIKVHRVSDLSTCMFIFFLNSLSSINRFSLPPCPQQSPLCGRPTVCTQTCLLHSCVQDLQTVMQHGNRTNKLKRKQHRDCVKFTGGTRLRHHWSRGQDVKRFTRECHRRWPCKGIWPVLQPKPKRDK